MPYDFMLAIGFIFTGTWYMTSSFRMACALMTLLMWAAQ